MRTGGPSSLRGRQEGHRRMGPWLFLGMAQGVKRSRAAAEGCYILLWQLKAATRQDISVPRRGAIRGEGGKRDFRERQRTPQP
eukprot:2414186-Pyramimonas_sp.AAC.1